ncbi:MAG: DUF3822 family protein [Chitinophagaceae bacterium]
MTQKILSIYSPTQKKDRLFLEISREHIACWTLHHNTEEVGSMELFQIEPEKPFEESFLSVMQNSGLLPQYNADAHVQVIWDNEFAEILPKDYFHSCTDNIIQMMMPYQPYDTQIQHYDTSNFSVLYQVDQVIADTLQKHFPDYRAIHKYGAIGKVLMNSVSSSNFVLHLLCFHRHSILTGVQNGQLLFIKRIKFLLPLDVVYHIVNAADQYGQDLEQVTVVLSGMLESDSSLFDAIYKYIPNIEIDSVTKNLFDAEKFNEYPEHYFVPFFKYAI